MYLKLLSKLLGATSLLCFFVFVALVWIYRDIPASDLEAKYASHPSKFVEVDGVRFHVRQEGQGPDVVLLHASFGNLFMWDGWVDHLSDDYRITRLDLIAHGLTGPGRADSYSTDEIGALLKKLLEALELDDFHLVGTSIGGIFAFTYAAENADQVESLTLINSAGLIHRNVNPNPVQNRVPLTYRLLARITPRQMMDDFFASLINIEEQVTQDVLDTYYEMIMREGNRQATLRGMRDYQPRDPSPWLSKIVAPTLVIWSEKSVLPQEEANEFMQLLANTETQVLNVEGGGHALPISHPVLSSEAASKFWQQVDMDSADYMDQ